VAPARGSVRSRPFLIELVGLPGTGKSSVFETLCSRNGRIAGRPILSRGAHAPVLAGELARILGMLVRRKALGRQWSLERLVMAAYLRALPRVLEGPRAPDRDAVVFDQGPIFSLTRPVLLDERLRDWWDTTFAAWRSLLDAVVWLEAPDGVLLERINSRAKPHRIKGGADGAALKTLAQNRAAYDFALSRLEAPGRSPAILRFDTSRQPAEEIVEAILAVIPAR
jgi:hypothetical protein